MPSLRRVVIDLLKPHEPTILELARLVGESDGVEGVDATLLETDRKVENVKLTIEGDDINFDDVRDVIDELGGSVHSIDKVAYGEYIVEERKTPQD
ncbi:hypothetical protein BG842_06970 [Haladaptatus sp. W1]|uniref:DUF211 domain-containing protein n=1 Tax=Haladaptatus sp. W1 TaxID=1897478 RepID=UPI000849BB9E|nr:DUF211 domain-containing protein [Haladaptatus sp. W1]ODR79406.1 hypothetical protein BG842_06970 [Haladaptatus sp. W1]